MFEFRNLNYPLKYISLKFANEIEKSNRRIQFTLPSFS